MYSHTHDQDHIDLNHHVPAATGLKMTEYPDSEAPRCPVMLLKGGSLQRRLRGGDASVIFSRETFLGVQGGPTTELTLN